MARLHPSATLVLKSVRGASHASDAPTPHLPACRNVSAWSRDERGHDADAQEFKASDSRAPHTNPGSIFPVRSSQAGVGKFWPRRKSRL
jgi:hypothetical protein